MCRRLLCFVLTLGLVSTTYGVVIGDFEGQMDGFGPTWEEPAPTLEYSAVGATSGNSSLSVQPNVAGWQWSFMREGILDLDTYDTLSVDVTWVAAEWGGVGWLNFKDIAINSGGPSGWMQLQPTDLVNPDWPGSWDPSWGDHTRTLTWDLSAYDATGTDWMQLIFSTNFDSGTATIGKYYIDNVQLIPEPTTIALLGLGGLALLRRRK